MAEESNTNRTTLIVLALIAIAIVGGVAFYAGRHNALQQSLQVPSAQQQAMRGAPRFTRLPPQKFGNWTLNCILDARQAKHCTLGFQAVDSTRRHLLLRMVVVRTQKGQPAVVVMTPPNALVAQGFKLEPAGGQAVTIPFLRCLPRACQASAVLSDSLMSGLNDADTTQATFVAATGRPISYKLPTQGFKEGYAAWQTASPATAANAGGAPSTIPADGQRNNGGQ